MDEREDPNSTKARKGAERITRRNFIQVMAYTTAGLALASCSAPSGPATATPGVKQAPAASTAAGAASPQPKKGGILKIPLTTNAAIPSLDSMTEQSGGTDMVAQQIYSKLVRYLAQKQTDGTYKTTYVPDVAQSWETPNDTTYVFHLRPGLKFQNVAPVNGRELTADDVVYSLERVRRPDPQFRYAGLFAGMKFEATDKSTVKVTTDKPNASVLYNLSNTMSVIMPKELAETTDIKKKAIGSGPFILQDYQPDQVVRLKRNPDYWDANNIYLDGIEIYIIPDKATRKAAYKSGQLDIGLRQFIETKADQDELVSAVPDTVLMKVPGGNRYDVYLKTNRAPLNNKKLRQALMFATDWKEIANICLEGDANHDSFLPWWMTPWTLPADQLKEYEQNLDKAKQLLAEAGFANGLTLKAPSTNNYDSVKTNQILQEQWKKIGVNLDISMLESNVWMNTVWNGAAGDFDVMGVRSGNFADPDYMISVTWQSNTGNNHAAYSNPEVDKLIADQRATVNDDEKRKQIFWQLQRALWDDAASIPLFTGYNTVAVRPYVHNFNRATDLTVLDWVFGYVWLDK